MKINKISNAIGQGVFSHYKQTLENEGYNVITFELNLMENLDLMNLPLPFSKSFETGIIKIVEYHHNKGEKVAIYLEDYESNKERVSFIKDMVENHENNLKLKDNDIVFYLAEDGLYI